MFTYWVIKPLLDSELEAFKILGACRLTTPFQITRWIPCSALFISESSGCLLVRLILWCRKSLLYLLLKIYVCWDYFFNFSTPSGSIYLIVILGPLLVITLGCSLNYLFCANVSPESMEIKDTAFCEQVKSLTLGKVRSCSSFSILISSLFWIYTSSAL